MACLLPQPGPGSTTAAEQKLLGEAAVLMARLLGPSMVVQCLNTFYLVAGPQHSREVPDPLYSLCDSPFS